MAEQIGDVAEELRRLSWELRISRDQLLKTAEGLPPSLLEQAQQAAEILMSFHRQIQEISARVPADVEDATMLAVVSEKVAGLRRRLAPVLWDLDLLIQEAHEVHAETPVSKAN
jgi:hypothetical protein